MKKSWALITGASSGIGWELAGILAKDGHSLVLVARSEGKLKELAGDLAARYGVGVDVLARDLAKPDMAAQVMADLDQKGIALDILVNNAGFGEFGEFKDTPWEREAEMIQLNITALTQLTKLCLPGMLKRKQGRIMNVASTAAFQPGPLMSVYYATKAYVLHFSEAIANELKGTGVTVTTLCPGPTISGFQAAANLTQSKLVKGRRLPSSADVAKYGYAAMMRGQGVAIHGAPNKFIQFAVRFMPRRLTTEAVRKYQETKTT
ncbi:MAG: SDR family NAD(P)-dependent oxidoreductase [Bacteriovoracia bacterium]